MGGVHNYMRWAVLTRTRMIVSIMCMVQVPTPCRPLLIRREPGQCSKGHTSFTIGWILNKAMNMSQVSCIHMVPWSVSKLNRKDKSMN